MTVLKSAFDPVVLSRTAPWSRKGMVFKRYHRPNSPGQRIAQANFGDAAYRAYGSTGLVGGKPAVAVAVQGALSGRAALGQGVAEGNAQRRREMSHNAWPGKAQALRGGRGAPALSGGPGPGMPF